ncbi:MAG: hypothetical protein WA131_00745 [Desulfitobacteriaceae bacterium]
MSFWKQLFVALGIGVSIGLSVPFFTGWLTTEFGHVQTPTNLTATAVIEVPNYHFVVNGGLISVVEGKPGEKGNVILSGLDVKVWPIDLLEMAPKVVFNSLDEVQSFIDTVSEQLWNE